MAEDTLNTLLTSIQPAADAITIRWLPATESHPAYWVCEICLLSYGVIWGQGKTLNAAAQAAHENLKLQMAHEKTIADRK